MKSICFILLVAAGISSSIAQTTNPLPPFGNTGNNAVTNNSVNSATGTPMVKNPVEANNPSVQATIPINSKPVSLVTDQPQNNSIQPARIINENAQANTPVKNTIVSATQGSPGTIVGVNISNDSISSVINTFAASKPVETTVIYNAATGVDAAKQSTQAVPVVTTAKPKSGNTTPVLQTYVSENIVNKFKSIYGESLYDIRLIKSATGKYIYIVRTQENGVYKTLFLDESGVVIP